MDNESKEEGSDGRESYGFKISELLKALAERESQPRDTVCIDPRNISTSLSILKNSNGTFRSRAVLPENISQLSNCQFQRPDHLSESPPTPNTAVASFREGLLQPTQPSSNPVIVVDKSKLQSSDTGNSVGECLKNPETRPHTLSLQACTMAPKVSPQTGPTNQWFFENLMDLQRKLFFGASKKQGVCGSSQMPDESAPSHCNSSGSSSLPPASL